MYLVSTQHANYTEFNMDMYVTAKECSKLVANHLGAKLYHYWLYRASKSTSIFPDHKHYLYTVRMLVPAAEKLPDHR